MLRGRAQQQRPASIRGYARTGDVKGFTARLIHRGDDVNERLPDGWTALMYASDLLDDAGLRVVEAALAAGADCNLRTGLDARTALMIAIDSGSQGVIKALLTAGADPSVCDGNGLNAVHYAAKRCSLSALAAIVAHHEPRRQQLLELLDAPTATLLKRPLHMAVTGAGSFGGSPTFVRALLGLGASALAPDFMGNTPAHVATGIGDPALCQALVEGSVHRVWAMENRDGLTPLAHGRRMGHCSVTTSVEAQLKAKARASNIRRRWATASVLLLLERGRARPRARATLARLECLRTRLGTLATCAPPLSQTSPELDVRWSREALDDEPSLSSPSCILLGMWYLLPLGLNIRILGYL